MDARGRFVGYALLRIAVGVNFAGHGLIRLHIGLAQFANSTAEHMAKSPLPHDFVLGFLYAVPVIEAIVGVALILGLATRAALVLASLLMICLTVGVASNQQWDIASQQLLYSFVLFALLFLDQYNSISLDGLFSR